MFLSGCSHLNHSRSGQPTSEVLTRPDGGILQRPPLIAVSILADILQVCIHTGESPKIRSYTCVLFASFIYHIYQQ